jgi:hypothetical protein
MNENFDKNVIVDEMNKKTGESMEKEQKKGDVFVPSKSKKRFLKL